MSPKTDQEKTFITSSFQLAVFSLSIRKFLNIQVAKVPSLVVSSFIPGQVNSKATFIMYTAGEGQRVFFLEGGGSENIFKIGRR